MSNRDSDRKRERRIGKGDRVSLTKRWLDRNQEDWIYSGT